MSNHPNEQQTIQQNGSNQFGNWSFTKHRFNTEKHPVITTKQLKRAKLETVLSSQEKQMLGGLTNTLQVEENEAIRIALYEASRSVSKGVETYRRHSDPQSTLTAHRGRNKKIAVKLPGTEKIQATKAAKQIGISEREFVRLSIIWLQKSILDESICRLTNSYKISQKKLFEEWVDEVYKTTDDYQSPVKNLKQAHKESYEAAELRGIEESTQLVEDIKAWGLDVGRGTLEAFNDEYGNFDFQGLREYYERMHQEPDEVFLKGCRTTTASFSITLMNSTALKRKLNGSGLSNNRSQRKTTKSWMKVSWIR